MQDLFHQQYLSFWEGNLRFYGVVSYGSWNPPLPHTKGWWGCRWGSLCFCLVLGVYTTPPKNEKHGNLKITKRTVIFQTTIFWVPRQFSQGIVCMVWLIIHPHVSRVQILFLVCSQQKFQHTSAPSTIYSQMSAHIIPGIQNTLVILLVPI